VIRVRPSGSAVGIHTGHWAADARPHGSRLRRAVRRHEVRHAADVARTFPEDLYLSVKNTFHGKYSFQASSCSGPDDRGAFRPPVHLQ
jgi:hypothetical protein